jgi:MoxR-like ATPase
VTTPALVIGREREVELLEAALDSGAHVVLEGPPGTGKSTLLRFVAADRATGFTLVEGNAELTPARLVGNFDPAMILSRGYVPDIFIDGPLVQALRSGGLLYVEELNRVPEETLNVLLTVMSEGELRVPRLGLVVAEEGFRMVAAMNPFDAVGTARISSALYDRTCRITMDYQSADAEAAIVAQNSRPISVVWNNSLVELVRSTRDHPDLRLGSSVRGAIDCARLATALADRRHVAADDWNVARDAALVSLSGRIQLHDSVTRSAESIIAELFERAFGAKPQNLDETADTGGDAPGEA